MADSYSYTVSLLEEAAELIQGYVDVRDGDDGPLPNSAMLAAGKIDEALGRLRAESTGPNVESPDEWYERERAAFIAWWESEGQKKFGEAPTLAAGAGWFARAERHSYATHSHSEEA